MTRPLGLDVVVATGGLGGAERFLLEVLDESHERLAVSMVCVGEAAVAASARARGWPVDCVAGGPRPADVARGGVALRRRWRVRRPDVVVANGVRAAASAVPAAAITGVPVVWMKHDFARDGVLSRVLGKLATRVVATSRAVAAGAHRADTVVVSPPRPAEPLARAEARARLRALGVRDHEGELLAVGLGRLVGYKGFAHAIEAIARPAAAAWSLAIIGDDEPADPGERARLGALARGLGVEDRVLLPGSVPDAGRLLTGCDAVLVPTTTDARGFGREGYGIVADEAMLAGVPLVVARGGAVDERLGDAGILVPPGDAEAVAGALERLADGDTRARFGTRGREIARSLPDARAVSDRFVAVAAAAAARPGAGRVDGPRVSVVVPLHDEGELVDVLVERIDRQLESGDELILVDDGSTDDTADRLAPARARHRVITLPRNRGASAARNAGIAAAHHEVIACTDAGCEPGAEWLESLRTAFAEDPRPGLVTGVYRVRATTTLERAAEISCYPDVGEARGMSLFTRAYTRVLGRRFESWMPTGRTVAFTRAAADAVGGFPEHLRTAEDVAFGAAIRDAGFATVLSADAEVIWDQRPTIATTARMYFGYGRGDGMARAPRLIARDLVRAGVYGLAPVLVVFGGAAGRVAVAVGAAAYLSLPVTRAIRGHASPAAVAAIPLALAVKDLAKAAGCVRALAARPAPVDAPDDEGGDEPTGSE